MTKLDLCILYVITATACFAIYSDSPKFILVAGWIASGAAISKILSMSDNDPGAS